MRDINNLIIHCSVSPQGRGDNAEVIDRWHKERGFKRTYNGKTYHIGYHYVILEDGQIEVGRPIEVSGAHCSGHNTGSIGICMIGKDSFTKKQIESLVLLCEGLSINFNLSSNDTKGHYEYSNKTCPNYDVGLIRNKLKEKGL